MRFKINVHVVMANDFPDGVWLTKRGADAYVARCKYNERQQGLVQPWNRHGPRIHYRVRTFALGW